MTDWSYKNKYLPRKPEETLVHNRLFVIFIRFLSLISGKTFVVKNAWKSHFNKTITNIKLLCNSTLSILMCWHPEKSDKNLLPSSDLENPSATLTKFMYDWAYLKTPIKKTQSHFFLFQIWVPISMQNKKQNDPKVFSGEMTIWNIL